MLNKSVPRIIGLYLKMFVDFVGFVAKNGVVRIFRG